MNTHVSCSWAGCNEPTAANVAVVRRRQIVAGGYFCDFHGNQFVKHKIDTEPVGLPALKSIPSAVRCEVFLIMERPQAELHCIHLRELGGYRWLAIDCEWVETVTLLSSIRTKAPYRPFMHDTLASVIRLLDGEVEHVIIDSFVSDNEHYTASIVIRGPNGLVTVDSRPCDAMSLAVRADVPIYVSDELLV
jgi:bifunctional DNase/RNase